MNSQNNFNHEWKVFYSGIGAIYNERLNQIRIFSPAEHQQKQDKNVRQLKSTHLWEEIGLTERNRFDSNLNTKLKTIETLLSSRERHSTRMRRFLVIIANALSSLRLSLCRTKIYLFVTLQLTRWARWRKGRFYCISGMTIATSVKATLSLKLSQ